MMLSFHKTNCSCLYIKKIIYSLRNMPIKSTVTPVVYRYKSLELVLLLSVAFTEEWIYNDVVLGYLHNPTQGAFYSMPKIAKGCRHNSSTSSYILCYWKTTSIRHWVCMQNSLRCVNRRLNLLTDLWEINKTQ